MQWKLAALILGLIPSLAMAVVVPIELRLPTTETVIRRKCENAFDQIDKDRRAVEAKEKFFCLGAMPGKDMKTIKEGFMILCERAVQSKIQFTWQTRVTVEVDALKAAFNNQYSPMIAAKCAANEYRRISAYNSAQNSSTGRITNTGRGMQRDCFFNNSCYTSR